MLSADDAANRARSLLDLGRHEQARALLVQALAADPEDPRLLGELARAHLGLGDHAAALNAVRSLVGVAPDDEWGHRLAAIALGGLGMRQDALRAADTAVRCGPNSWQTHLQYALTAIHVPGWVPVAGSAARRAVELAPDEADAHFAVGVVAQEQREFETAAAAYRRALALDPEHANARNNLTLVEGSFNFARASRGYVAALRADPRNTHARDNLEGVADRVLLAVIALQFVGFIVNLMLLLGQPGPIEDSRPGPTNWIIAAAAAGLGIAGLLRLRASLSRGTRLHLRRQALRPLKLLWLLAIIAIIVAGPIATAVVPGAALLGLALLRPLGISTVIAVVLVVTQSRKA
jgi:tetratricopeptide (TPR) repeat protein